MNMPIPFSGRESFEPYPYNYTPKIIVFVVFVVNFISEA